MIFTIYKKHTGEIKGYKSCSDDSVLMMDHFVEDEDLVDTNTIIDGRSHYYDLANTFTVRPEMTATPNKLIIAADGADTFILTGLPIPCTVSVDTISYDVDDGEFGFPTTLPGTYIVKAIAFPYVEKTWEVIAV